MSLLQLQELPQSLVIIGGGYIAAEYGYFFSAMGTHVSIVQNQERLLPSEEPEIVWENAVNGGREPVNYSTVPRAVFTYPPVAAVGLTKEQASENNEILVGTARCSDVAKGMAMREDRGMAKVVLEKESQEAANAMAIGGQPGSLFAGQHIHPSLTELIPKVFGSLSEPE